jgi:hypothetical protein
LTSPAKKTRVKGPRPTPGQNKRRGEFLTSVQKDCVERMGQCNGCPNNIMSSTPCMVRFSAAVRDTVGATAEQERAAKSTQKYMENNPARRNVTCPKCSRSWTTTRALAEVCPDCVKDIRLLSGRK